MLTQDQAEKLNQDNPTNMLVSLGDEIKDTQETLQEVQAGGSATPLVGNGAYQELSFVYNITTGASDIKILDVPVDLEIVEVIIQARGASTNGTLKLTDGTNDITDAMTCAVDTTMGSAANIDDAYGVLDAGEEVHAVCAGDTPASTKALVLIRAIPR